MQNIGPHFSLNSSKMTFDRTTASALVLGIPVVAFVIYIARRLKEISNAVEIVDNIRID
jgi:hypothetical protein